VITVLAGGVGAARFLQGLVAVHRPSDITVISNVGDDAEFFGLHVSPDIDIVLYHLAGLANEEQGFGLRGDTYSVLEAIGKYGYDTWFRLGDRDLATCITRTDLLRRGKTLAEATAEIASALLVPVRITPVTNAPLRTKIRTDDGVVDFQEYFVKRRTEGHAWEIVLDGVEKAAPAPGVIDAIRGAQTVILTPSNPLVSIGPILAVTGVREALRETSARVVAVSPIVGGRTIKGPADRMLQDQGLTPSAATIAQLYGDFLDALVIDSADEALAPAIAEMPARSGKMQAVVTDTIMASMEKKTALARTVLSAASAGPG
jgi:LPPG:FO 2-phospho-L-lactate transferase